MIQSPQPLQSQASANCCDERLDFTLPSSLEADRPPEARGLARDEVRLMVSYLDDNHIVHTRFRRIGNVLRAGDVLVINTSGTMNAALHAWRKDGTRFELHLSTHLPADLWLVELRALDGTATRAFYDGEPETTFNLEGGASVTLHVPYYGNSQRATHGRQRLWVATLQLPCPLQDFLARYGFPIRYGYVKEQWPLDYYQTVYVTEVGSAEMPSAGRAFTPELITRLIAQGVQFAPLLLHTGVASLEEDEPPVDEYYRVPVETASLVNMARRMSRRVVAVGTTVVRALESVTDATGIVHPGEGWTHLVITPERGVRAIDGLLTGFHEPHATHLWMLAALAGRAHLARSYAEALREGYLWHEFGDLHLILPSANESSSHPAFNVVRS
jgi:S-adenosylmethionine:tRNA ribosyltransferase-isomerase